VNCDAVILLTSDRPDIHEELYEYINRFNRKNINIIDLFQDNYKRQLRQIEVDKKEQLDEIRETQDNIKSRLECLTKIEEERLYYSGGVYHPKKTNSVFYLPHLPADLIQRIIFLSDDYFESENLNYVFNEFQGGIVKDRVLCDSGVVVDIGANIGNHTLYFLNELKARKVFAFEPLPECFYVLKKNVEINDAEDRTELHQVGLSDKKGNGVVKRIVVENMGGTSIKDNVGGGCIEVKTLDEYDIEDVRFMKIDVEGMELQVLRGARNTILKNKPFMLIEIFDWNFENVMSFLTDFSYTYIKCGVYDYLFCPD
jgi:FkbM family methyltransferase